MYHYTIHFQEENVSDDESEVEFLHNGQSSEVERNPLDITGIPDTTLNLQPSLSNDEKNEDSENSNEEEMSVNSENSFIKEDLQDFKPSLSNNEKNEDSEDSNDEKMSAVNSKNILIEEDLQDFEELNSIGSRVLGFLLGWSKLVCQKLNCFEEISVFLQ